MNWTYEDFNSMTGALDEVLSEEEKQMVGMVSNDSLLVNKAIRLVEADMAQSMTLAPLEKVVDKKTLYPWYGKESDAEIVFNFEDLRDAENFYNFIVNTELLKPGEVKMKFIEGQSSVHFASHVLVTKPEVIQAALMAYEDSLIDDEYNNETYESLASEVGELITERTKISGAPKGMAKGNPFHDKNDGKFTGPDQIAQQKGGSFVSGKTKLKFAKASKSKKGDKVVQFASTKRPCGRKAREAGKDVRCWDGNKGLGFGESLKLAKVMKQHFYGEEVSDEDIKGMVEAIKYIKSISERQKEDPGLAFKGEEGKVRKGSFKLSKKIIDLLKKEAGIDNPEEILFKSQREYIDKIPYDKFPSIWNKDNMADAQDVIANNPKNALRLWMNNISKVAPKMGRLIRSAPENIPLWFYATILRVSGRDIADIILKRYFVTNENLNYSAESNLEEEVIKWKEVNGNWVKEGPYAKFVIKKQQGPGMPIYVLYVKIKETGSTLRRKGQSKSIDELMKIGDKWCKSMMAKAGMVDFSKDWISYKREI